MFTRKLAAFIEQRIMLEKVLGQVRTDPDSRATYLILIKSRVFIYRLSPWAL